ncbi:MAG: carboxymuconolactone decarboxylase family protein [Planctomycetales bacterium]|nr:carboxymuconolactone decarboxylase family protein [Planctomycetales bacterium]
MSSSPPPATVPLADPATATGKVAEVFADIMQVKGIDFVPRFWRALAVNPDHLESVWRQLKYWMHPEACGREPKLDARTREMIAIAVSATNGCSYCVNSHTATAQKLGMDAATLGEVLAIAGLFNMTNALADGMQIEPDVRPSFE